MATQLGERPVTHNGQPLAEERGRAPDLALEQGGVRRTGWLTFAAVALGIAGTLNTIDGIVALAKSRFYTATAVYVFSDLRTWGWIVLGLGVVQILAALAVVGRAQWARWVGMIAAGVGALVQFAFMQSYPFWSLSIFAVCILVIYALAVYGGSPKRAETS